MGLVDNLINDKNVRIKTASITLIFLIASISFWSMYGAPVWGANNKNNNSGTTIHKVTINVIGQEVSSQIEPLNLTIPETSSCGCQSCVKTQDQTNMSLNELSIKIINYTALEQNENRISVLVMYEFNNTISEITVTTELLWSYNERLNNINRTATFLSTRITTEGKSIQYYSFSYLVQNLEYSLTAYIRLLPLDSKTYNSSFIVLNYVPANESETVSLELVNFNLPVTLSQNYRILGKVAREMGALYSMNRTLAYLTERYITIEAEANYLMKLISRQLQEYDHLILKSGAIIMDGCTYDSDCSYIGQGYVCLGSSCGPCFSCSQSSQCVSQFGQGWTCYGGCCRQPGYQPPPPPPPPQSWVCSLVCTVACSLGCALGTGYICVIACSTPCAGCVGIPSPWTCSGCFWCGIMCGAVAWAVCQLIGTYTCSPGCGWLCSHI